MTDHRLLSDADLAAARPVTPAELEKAHQAVCAMSRDEFMRAAIHCGLIPAKKPAPRPQQPKRTAEIRVVASGQTFGVQCGWCHWSTGKLSFNSAQKMAHTHNRNSHRDHCMVKVAA